jgi:hypothetical protein
MTERALSAPGLSFRSGFLRQLRAQFVECLTLFTPNVFVFERPAPFVKNL